MATIEQYIGQPLLRKEDAKLLAGEGSFIDNQSMAGMVWIALVRPPYVHATIEGVDTAAAAAMPGVVARVHRGRPPRRMGRPASRWSGPTRRTSRSRRTTR